MADAPTTNMGLIKPTEDSAVDAGDWDRLLNDVIDLIDAHDHTTGKGVRIPSAGLNINADLSFGGFRATSLTGVDFSDLGALLTSGAQEIFSFAGNLYWRNGSGQNVRITSGSSIDVSSVGGIAGDYAAIGAEFAYSDASDTYTAKQQLSAGVRQWARVGTGSVDLYEYRAAGDPTGITNRVRHSSPAGLAASYEVTWPGAVPGSTLIMQMSSTGVISVSNTIPNAATFSAAVTFAALITASAGLTCASNQNVTVSGTGDFKHGDKILVIPSSFGEISSAGTRVFTPSTGATASGWLQGGNGEAIVFGIPLKSGDRIKEVRTMLRDTAAGNTMSMQLRQSTSADANTQVGSTQTSAGDATNQTLAITGLTSTIATGNYYNIVVTNNSATTTTHKIYGVEVTYDRP